MNTNQTLGEAVPAPQTDTFYAATTVALTQLSYESGHHSTTAAGRMALCAMALAIVVRMAARLPKESAERRALARAARELREVV